VVLELHIDKYMLMKMQPKICQQVNDLKFMLFYAQSSLYVIFMSSGYCW